MDYTTYKIIHLIGIAILAIGLGGMMANGNNHKTFAVCQGIGLLVMLVSGFGLLAKLHLGFPHFAIAKLVFWLVIGMFPMLIRKLKPPLSVTIIIAVSLIGVMAWLGVFKPGLW